MPWRDDLLTYECVYSPGGPAMPFPHRLDAFQGGDTSDANPDYYYGAGEYPGQLAGWGLAGGDEVYQFTPSTTRTCVWRPVGFRPDAYIVTMCGHRDQLRPSN